MNIAVCDDDKTVVKEAEALINEFFADKGYDYELYTFTSGKELLSREVQFDIVYLDIEMPEISGLEVAKRLFEKNKNTIIMIITSFQHYIDDAMELRVYRYISKPFDKERFFTCLKFAFNNYLTSNKPIKIKSNDEITKINSCDIIYLSIENEKVYVHTYDGSIRTTENFGYWLRELDGLSFFQVHQSFIVNLAYVKKVSKGNALLICKDKTYNICVSTRKYVSFKKALHSYIGGLK